METAARPSQRVLGLDPARIRRILVIRNDNIGDVLCTTPALAALRRVFPAAHLAILVASYSREALADNPDMDEVLVYTKHKHRPDGSRLAAWREMAALFGGVRAQRYDVAIAMRAHFTGSLGWLALLSGAPVRIGYAPPPRHPLGFAITHPLPLPGGPAHEVERCLRLLEPLGVRAERPALVLARNGGAEAAMRESLMRLGVAHGAALVVMHVSSRRTNRWPADRFAALGDWAAARGATVVLADPPGEAHEARTVAEKMSHRPILQPTRSLRELAALVSHCRLCVCCDGGAMHVAAAVGTPTVAIFGAADPGRWAPWGAGHRVLWRDGIAEAVTLEEAQQAVAEVWDGRGAA
jgi:ADP-heptose:LPS heptosyltransferase